MIDYLVLGFLVIIGIICPISIAIDLYLDTKPRPLPKQERLYQVFVAPNTTVSKSIGRIYYKVANGFDEPMVITINHWKNKG